MGFPHTIIENDAEYSIAEYRLKKRMERIEAKLDAVAKHLKIDLPKVEKAQDWLAWLDE